MPRDHKRPGKGGRDYSRGRIAWTKVMAELRAELGEPVSEGRRMHARFVHWQIDPEGDIIVLLRLSGREVQNGETALHQLRSNMRAAARFDLRVRDVIFTAENSGKRDYADRADLQYLAHAFRAGLATGVMARDTSRLVRSGLTRETLYRDIRDQNASLWFSDMGKIDWNNPQHAMILSMRGVMDENYASDVKRNTERGRYNLWVAKGLGSPGCMPYPFYFDKNERAWKIDEEGWDHVRTAMQLYDQLNQGRSTGGIRQLAVEMKKRGCSFSDANWALILRDERYLTGEVRTDWHGQLVIGKPVPIPDHLRIPRDLFQRIQQNLAKNKGSYTATPYGANLLNNIPFYHATCMEELVPSKWKRIDGSRRPTTPMLRVNQAHSPSYTHAPRVACCSRRTFSKVSVETTFAQALRELAAHPRLVQAALVPTSPASHVGAGEQQQQTEIEAMLRRAEQRLREAHAAWADSRSPESQVPRAEYLANVITPLQDELSRLQRELKRFVPDAAHNLGLTPAQRAVQEGRIPDRDRRKLIARFHELMTDETPDDPDHRTLRAILAIQCVSAVILHDTDHGVEMEIQGPLIPERMEGAELTDPVGCTKPLLESGSVQHGPPCTTRPQAVRTLDWTELADLDWHEVGHPGAPSKVSQRTPDRTVDRPGRRRAYGGLFEHHPAWIFRVPVALISRTDVES